MNSNDHKRGLFIALKSLLLPYELQLICTKNEFFEYSLDTPHIMKNKKSLFFSAVKINKLYVSFHLMPIYSRPDLLTTLSSTLKDRMHGKSCFNFNIKGDVFDSVLLEEITLLTKTEFIQYQSEGYI